MDDTFEGLEVLFVDEDVELVEDTSLQDDLLNEVFVSSESLEASNKVS